MRALLLASVLAACGDVQTTGSPVDGSTAHKASSDASDARTRHEAATDANVTPDAVDEPACTIAPKLTASDLTCETTGDCTLVLQGQVCAESCASECGIGAVPANVSFGMAVQKVLAPYLTGVTGGCGCGTTLAPQCVLGTCMQCGQTGFPNCPTGMSEGGASDARTDAE